jgi:hypothetical protein
VITKTPQLETRQRRLCSVIAREQGHDPIGTAWAVERMLVVELPLPWPEDFFAARAFPLGLADTLMALWDEHPDTGLLAIAPDRDYSRPDRTRVIDFRYPAPPRAAATRAEYLVPSDRVGEFVAALFVDDPAALAMPGAIPRARSPRLHPRHGRRLLRHVRLSALPGLAPGRQGGRR